MEESIERKLILTLHESAGLRGAVALRGFLERNGHARKQWEIIKSVEIAEEKIHWVGPDDFEEYEAGHDLNRGTFAKIWQQLNADLQEKGGESAANRLRWRKSQADGVLLAAEDLHELAGSIISGEAKVAGLGQVRAGLLRSATAVWTTEAEA